MSQWTKYSSSKSLTYLAKSSNSKLNNPASHALNLNSVKKFSVPINLFKCSFFIILNSTLGTSTIKS